MGPLIVRDVSCVSQWMVTRDSSGYHKINVCPLKCTVYNETYWSHYSDVIMGAKASQITSLTIVYSTVYSGTDQRKHQKSASLAFVRGIHW